MVAVAAGLGHIEAQRRVFLLARRQLGEGLQVFHIAPQPVAAGRQQVLDPGQARGVGLRVYQLEQGPGLRGRARRLSGQGLSQFIGGLSAQTGKNPLLTRRRQRQRGQQPLQDAGVSHLDLKLPQSRQLQDAQHEGQDFRVAFQAPVAIQLRPHLQGGAGAARFVGQGPQHRA